MSDWRFVAVDDLDAFLTQKPCAGGCAHFLGGMRGPATSTKDYRQNPHS